jgi:hypothetical protein
MSTLNVSHEEIEWHRKRVASAAKRCAIAATSALMSQCSNGPPLQLHCSFEMIDAVEAYIIDLLVKDNA